MPVITGTAASDTLTAPIGSWENWTINGLEGDDILEGANGNDILDGGTGADRMRGGFGADIYYVDNAGDTVEGASGDEIRTSLTAYQLPFDVSVLTGLVTTGQTLTGNYSDNTINGNAGDDRIWGGAGIDRLVGGGGNDTYILKDYDSDRSDTIVEAANGGVDEVLVGLSSYTLHANVENATATGANITLTGNSLANVLRGSSVNDTLDGGTGADTLIGGAGSDFYYIDNAGDTIVEDLASSGGTGDTVVTAFAYYQLQAGLELVQGTSATQTLVGHDGDNWLMSKGGGDTLIGGRGNDLYEIQAGDIIVEHAGEGIDLVRTTMASYTLPEHFEELQATSFTSSQILIGNAANNRIIGTLLNNQSDTIDGRGGADLMIGYHGSDLYFVDHAGDVVQEESHHGTADEVRTSIDLTLFANVEKLTAQGSAGLRLTGNGLANTISGGDGSDRIEGLAGADRLTGGVGNDAFRDTAANFNGDTITDFAAGDTIVFSNANMAAFSFSLSGSTLTYTGGSLTLTGVTGNLYASAAVGGGVQLSLARPAASGARAGDFNGDGRSDILWRASNGTVTDWLGQADGGFAGNFGNANLALTNDWQVAGTGDFNGDRRDDILWRASNGTVTDWLGAENGGFVGNFSNANLALTNDWQIAGTGDFNGDGRDDILWRAFNGTVTDWLGTENGGFAGNFGNANLALTNDWQIAGTGDFNGDGRDDILWRASNGTVTDWLGTENGGFIGNFGNANLALTNDWQIAGTGDFNGDGRDDILWRASNGTVTNWLGQADGGFVGNFDNANLALTNDWQIAGTGDFNGDGRDDILWRAANGTVTDWLGTADGGFTGNFGNANLALTNDWQIQPGGDLF